MMYSQQEYEMVRRQTIQMEAEKRVALRWAFTMSLLVTGVLFLLLIWLYSQYSSADSRVSTAEQRTSKAEAELKKVSVELAEKKAILDKQAATAAAQNQVITTVLPRALGNLAGDFELAQLAQAIYESRPGHMMELSRIPPDQILRRYRIRVGQEIHTYVFVAGLVDGKWVLYSNLVGKGIPQPKPTA